MLKGKNGIGMVNLRHLSQQMEERGEKLLFTFSSMVCFLDNLVTAC